MNMPVLEGARGGKGSGTQKADIRKANEDAGARSMPSEADPLWPL